MKLFTSLLLLVTVLAMACSTNSNPATSVPETTRATPVVYKTTVATTGNVDKTGIRPIQKYYSPPGTTSGPVRIIIDKSDFEIREYDSKGLLAA